ncbi:MAG: RagB/SusD family nutrient uptake outer membrane protein [Mediterranea sp.]|jgi:hypothetical protein|nr:RagB/SusD family nutrient uptake outer membrane protein [Mediterranea sp.]
MNKKSIIKAFIAGASLALLSACADSFLDTTSKSTLTDENYYKTVADAQHALTGCYDGLQVAYCYNNVTFLLASEIMSDNCFAGGGVGDNQDFLAIDEFDNNKVSGGNILEPQWKYYYTAINRCNLLLSKDGQINWDGDEQTRLNIIGQCRAIRALCYFDLTRLFGSVPLLTEPTVAKVAQAEPAAIYQLIGEDLKFAADNIKLGAWTSSWTNTNDGLISEYAAKALLARAYLFYTGFYKQNDLAGISKSEVLGGLEQVISEGGFDLLPSFSSLWPCASRQSATNSYTWAVDNYAGEGNQETLFALKFDSNSDQGTNQNGSVPMFSMRNTKFSPYGTGWGVATVNKKLYDAYGTDDTRRDASIINIDGEGISASSSFNTGGDWREYTGYSVKKYSAQAYYDGTDAVQIENPDADFQYYQGQDYVVMRYADVLLMAAEMGSPNAQLYYDRVRSRAGLSSKAVSTANLMEERRLEFAFEGLRYWDLLRQGLENAANTLAQNQNGTTVESGGVAASINVTATNITGKGGLLQKPVNQITLMGSDVLQQNQGW